MEKEEQNTIRQDLTIAGVAGLCYGALAFFILRAGRAAGRRNASRKESSQEE